MDARNDRAGPSTRDTGAGRVGMTLLEVLVTVVLLLLVGSIAGKHIMEASRIYSSVARKTFEQTRARVILDRLLEDLVSGSFNSMIPDVPQGSGTLEFQKITGTEDGFPVFGTTIRIDTVPLESDGEDGIDNDGNGLIDEQGIRVSQRPTGVTVTDLPVVICATAARDGLQFTREGSILRIDLTVQTTDLPGDPPRLIHLTSAVKMRNG